MELSPNGFFLLLKIRRRFMVDEFLRNGFKNRYQLAVSVENNYSPSSSTLKFIDECLREGVLFVEGSLKLDLERCDVLISEYPLYLFVKDFIRERYMLVGKSLFEED